MKHTIEKKKKVQLDATQVDEHFSHDLFFSATSGFLLADGRWQFDCLALQGYLVQVESLDTTLSTVGTMPSIPEDGIAARDWWFEDIPWHSSGMRALWR